MSGPQNKGHAWPVGANRCSPLSSKNQLMDGVGTARRGRATLVNTSGSHPWEGVVSAIRGGQAGRTWRHSKRTLLMTQKFHFQAIFAKCQGWSMPHGVLKHRTSGELLSAPSRVVAARRTCQYNKTLLWHEETLPTY